MMAQKPYVLIFTHMPKAAGTSLVAAIKRQYKNPKVLDLGRHPVKKYVDQYSTLLEEERANIDLVVGHYPFGLHSLIPRPCVYITMLREPIARVVSHYYQVLRDPSHYAYERGFSPKMSLYEYVESGVAEEEISNGQTRFMAGLRPDADNMLDSAIQNGEACYKVVGIAEQFDQSLMLMRRELNWQLPVYHSRHVYGQERAANSEKAIKAIKRKNELDLQLYEHFANRFQDEIDKQISFERWEVHAFQLINGIYKTYVKTRLQAGQWKAMILKGKNS